MLDGLEIRRRYEREQHAESLYLLRYIATTLVNVIQGLSQGGKAVDQLDIFPIPEIDDVLKKAKQEHERRREQHAERVLQKYLKLQEKLRKQRGKGQLYRHRG